MKFNLESADMVSVMTVQGPMDGTELEQLREALMVSISISHHVIINISNATGIDGECLKTICTAQKAARKMNRRLTVHGADTANTPA